MIILSLEISHYGKMKDRIIPLRPGVNVITGDNETGKTTLASFIRSMFYGVSPKSEEYRHFYPREDDGRFGGAMVFENHDNLYRVERELSAKKQFVRLTNETTGAIVQDPDEKLKRMLAGLSREAFEATAFVCQDSYTTDLELYRDTKEKGQSAKTEAAVRQQFEKGREILRKQREALAAKRDLSLRNDMIDWNKAAEDVKESIKTTDEEKTAVMKKRELAEQELFDDQKTVQEKNQEREAQYRAKKTAAENEWKAFEAEKLRASTRPNFPGLLFLVTGVLCLLAGGHLAIAHSVTSLSDRWFMPVAACALAALVLLVMGILFTVANYRFRKKAEKELQEETEKRSAAAENLRLYEEYMRDRASFDDHVRDEEARQTLIREYKETEEALSKHQAALLERRRALVDKSEDLKKREEADAALVKEIRAVDVAIASFERVGKLDEELFRSELTEASTDYFRKMIPKRGGEMSMEAGIGVMEFGKQKFVLNHLSTGTMQTVFLAIRLANLDKADPQRKVPIILDDALAHFDETRTETILDTFRSSGRQIVLFSCRKRSKA